MIAVDIKYARAKKTNLHFSARGLHVAICPLLNGQQNSAAEQANRAGNKTKLASSPEQADKNDERKLCKAREQKVCTSEIVTEGNVGTCGRCDLLSATGVASEVANL